MARKFKVKVNGREYIVEVEEIREKSGSAEFSYVGQPKKVAISTAEPPKSAPVPTKDQEISGEGKIIKVPMSGSVLKIYVKPGDTVNVGDTLLVFEAMKMENELKSPYPGVVKEVLIKEGDMVETGQTVVILK